MSTAITFACPGQDLEAVIRENLGVMGFRVMIERVKVPTGGATQWVLPSGETAPELSGVVVAWRAENVLWPAGPAGQTQKPLCASRDGVTGVTQGGMVQECATCPQNQFTENGKKCKNMRKVYLVRPGSMFPVEITLPPTSVSVFDRYVMALTGRGKRMSTVLTAFSLERAGEGAKVYSRVRVHTVRDLSPEEVAGAGQLVAALRPHLPGFAAAGQAPAVVPEAWRQSGPVQDIWEEVEEELPF